jgi:hypothetical protein
LIYDESGRPGRLGGVCGYCIRDIARQSLVPRPHSSIQQLRNSRAADNCVMSAMSVPSGHALCSALALNSNCLPHVRIYPHG